MSEPTFPGCVIPVKVIAVFRTRDEEGQDDKLLCVPQEDPNWNELDALEDVAKTLRTEIEHFWRIYKEPEGKSVEIQGWEDRDVALGVIERAARAGARRAGRRALPAVSSRRRGRSARAGPRRPRSGARSPRTRSANSGSSTEAGLARCGVMITFSSSHSGWPSGSGSGSVTSSPAPSDGAVAQRLHERVRVDQRAAGDVGDPHVVAHRRQLARADEVARAVGGGRGDHDVVGERPHLVELVGGEASGRRPRPRGRCA